MLKVGQPAPGFELPDADMNLIQLSDFLGCKNVLVYFYPKDDTPGCTTEAIEFTDIEDRFADLDTVILGISPDDCLTHGDFRDKHGLSINLLADMEADVCQAYGVMQEREIEGGGTRRCVLRSTFVIDKDGIVREALYGVNPRGHAKQMLERVRSL
jgi:peroxiredoxin Q/BCP